MSYVNFDDVFEQLLDAKFVIDASDVEPCIRKRKKIDGMSQKGWFNLYEMPLDNGQVALSGAYGWWIGGESFVESIKVRVDGRVAKLTKEQKAAQRAIFAEAKRKEEARIKQRQEEASNKASRWWRRMRDAGQSGYMAKKGFADTELFGARVSDKGNLVIPLQDTTGKIYGLQVVMPTKGRNGRDKDFTPPGLAKKEHFFQIGLVQRGGVVLLCEGFATGASLRKATGLPVIVAFDAGNLMPVAIAIYKAHRHDVKILVCADDDYIVQHKPGCFGFTPSENPVCRHCGEEHGKINAGKNASTTAALAVNGAVVWPVFPDERPTDSKGPTDFNDLHVHPGGGLQAVRTQVESALTTAGWRAPKRTASADVAQQGGGDSARTGDRNHARSVMALDDLVERFVPLDDGTGKYVFDTWTNKVAMRDQMIALLPAGVRGDDIKRHPVWVERGAYYLDEVGFDPSGNDRLVKLNTWKGWPMAPKAGSCELLLDLLRYLCNVEDNGDAVFTWVLRWMAYPLQHPGAKMSSAIVMHGPQGTGKSTIWQCLSKIYGDYSTVLNQRGLEDRFNSDWVDSKLFLLAEEVVTRAEMWHIKNELKELVTGEWVRVNPKNIAAYRQRNQVNVVYLSNENQPLPIDNDDRRHCVIYTPPALRDEFYDTVFHEIDNGGVEALYQYLLDLDMGDFHPKKRPPWTEAKAALIALSSPSEIRFMYEWGSGELGLPVCPAKSTDIYAVYLRWCRNNGEQRPRPSNQFHGAISRLPGWTKKKERINRETSSGIEPCTVPVITPPENLISEAYRYKLGTEEIAWRTRCVNGLADAIQNSALRSAA